MRGLFSRLGGASPKAQAAPASAQQDVELPKLLSKTGELLKQLRDSSSEDFPLLNEATRHMQLLEGSVAALPDGESKTVWRSQLFELQKELKSSTEKMLSSSQQPANPASGRYDTAAEGQGASLFEGMSLRGGTAPSASDGKKPAPSQSAELEKKSSGMELAFSPPVLTSHKGGEHGSAKSAPLPEDLFSGLDDLSLTLGVPAPEPGQDIARSPEKAAPVGHSANELEQLPPSQLPRQGSDVSSVGSASVGALGQAPGSVRKKRITRRVGYARHADKDDPPAKTKQSSAPGAKAGSAPQASSTTASVVPPAPDAAKLDSSLDLLGHPSNESIAAPAPPQSDNMATTAPSGASRAQSDDLLPIGRAEEDKSISLSSWNKESKAAQQKELLGASAQQEPPPAQVSSTEDVYDQAQTPAAVERGVKEKLAELERQVASVAAKTSEVRQKRRALLADITTCTRELEEATRAEAAAVDAEDFEKAAASSAQADAAKARLAELHQAVRAADGTCERLVKERLALVEEQGRACESAAQALRSLQTRREDSAAAGAQALAQAEVDAAEAQSGSQEHLDDLRARMEARERWLTGERKSLDAKIKEATAPATAARDRHAEAAEALRYEVEALRAALAAKEDELAHAEAELEDSEGQVRALSSKYDRVKQHLEHDEQALAAQRAEYEEAQAAAQEATFRAQAAVAEACERQKGFLEQAKLSQGAAQSMRDAAASIRKQVEAESSMLTTHNSLATELQQAEALVKKAEQNVEEARAATRALSGQRAKLFASAQVAEERSAVARERLPDLEAGKKAAASARDFKEAARLAAEAKAKAAEADSELARAENLRKQAAGLSSEETAAASRLDGLENTLMSAQRHSALASWRQLRAVSLDLQAQIAAAVSTERFSEADALQIELDAANTDAAALQSAQHFTDSDLGSLLKSLSDLAASQGPAALSAASARTEPHAQPSAAEAKLTGEGVHAEPHGSEQDKAAAEQPEASCLDFMGDETSVLAEAPGPEHHAENGDEPHPGACAEPDRKLGEVAASEAERPTSAPLSRGSASNSRQQLAVIGLNRQLTDERTLSGYVTDTDSTAEVLNLSRGDSEVSGGQLPAAKQLLQSTKSQEALAAAGLDRQRPSHARLPSGYLADSDSQDLGNLKHHGSIDSTAATVATSKPFSDASLPDISAQVIPECTNAAESENGHPDEQEHSPSVPVLALNKMPLPSPPRRVSVTSEALSHNSRLDTPVMGGQKGPVIESLTSEQVAALEGLDSNRSAPSESGAPGHVFSLAETARMFHRDNYGSTAATVGNSTNFGGSDAGTGVSYSEALGSARGLHSLGPSESSSDAGDLHLPGSEEGGLHSYDSRRGQAKLRRQYLGGDTLHEETSSRDNASFRSDEAMMQTQCSESPQSTPSVLSPGQDKHPGELGREAKQEGPMAGPDFAEDSSVQSKDHAGEAGADMFAGLTLG